MSKTKVTLEVGSKEWKEVRRNCTVAIPGKFSALYYLNDKVLGHGPLVPMSYRAHYALCLFAENATGIPEIDEARAKLALVPRGMGKSTLITKGLGVQKLLKHDDFALGIANEVQDNAEGFLEMIKQEFTTNQFLLGLFPERVVNPRETTWKSSEIVLPRNKPRPMSPSVLAAGVGATVTGVHMDMWVCDDLLSQNAAEAAQKGNFGEIESTNRWVHRLPPLLCSPERDPLFFIGTRWWQGDTYDHLIEYFGNGEEPVEYKWTLKLPDGETQTITLVRVGDLAIFKRPAIENGRAIFPERYDLEELEKMAQRDPVFYAGQYLLEPSAGGASKFNEDWLKFYELDGKQLRYRDQLGEWKYQPLSDLITFVSVDPAFTKNVSGCNTAIPVVGTNGSELFLLEDFAMQGMGENDIAEKVIEFNMRYRPNKVFVETIVAQVVIANTIRRVAADLGLPDLPIHEIKSHGGQKKDWRIFALEPIFRRGTFYIHRSHQNFIREYTTFPLNKLRDVLDAIAFQRDEWERVAQFGRTATNSVHGAAIKASHDAAIARIRAAVGESGGY